VLGDGGEKDTTGELTISAIEVWERIGGEELTKIGEEEKDEEREVAMGKSCGGVDP